MTATLEAPEFVICRFPAPGLDLIPTSPRRERTWSNHVFRPEYPLWIATQPEQPNAALEVLGKCSGEVVTRVALADEATIDRAIGAATAAAPAMGALAAHAREEILDRCVARFRERAGEVATGLCVEAGQPTAMNSSSTSSSAARLRSRCRSS